MSALGGLINRLNGRLTAAGIPFVVGGSFALAAAGHPRFTQDIDIMVLVADDTRLQQALAPPGFRQINDITYEDEETGLFIDLAPVMDDAQKAALERTTTVAIHGSGPVRVLTPDGLVLMLLREATIGDERKRPLRLRDVEVLAASTKIDWGWVEVRAQTAGYEQALQDVPRAS